jgi:hypothetical protein
MRKISLGLVIMVLLGGLGVSLALAKGPGAENDMEFNRYWRYLAKNLEMTDEQVGLLEKYSEEMRTKIQQIRDSDEDLDDKYEEIRELKQEGQEYFESLLTEEQEDLYDKMDKRWPHRHGHRVIRGKPGIRGKLRR